MNKHPIVFDTTYFNNTKTVKPALIKAQRQLPYIDTNQHESLSIIRFDVNTDLIPVFVPQIRNNNDDFDSVQQGYSASEREEIAPKGTDVDANSTDMFIVIEWKNITTKYHVRAVEWIPVEIRELPPSDLRPENIIASRYYYCYSTMHITTIIQNTLNEMLKEVHANLEPLIIQKHGTEHSLMIPDSWKAIIDFTELSISFSSNLMYMYPFLSVPHDTVPNMETIVLSTKNPKTEIDGSIYEAIATQHTTTSFMRFRLIEIVSTQMPIESQLNAINLSSERDGSQKVMTDFLINTLTDANEIYDKVYFQPSVNNFRPIEIVGGNQTINDFTCQLLLKTAEGYSTPLLLKPGRYCSVKFSIS